MSEREPTDWLVMRLRNLAALIEASERRGDFPIGSGDHQPVSVTLRDAAFRLASISPTALV